MLSLGIDSLSAYTRCCGVLGHPVRHSGSPAMQNEGIRRLGLDWRYLAFDVRPGGLAGVILGAQRMGFVGLNLTVPHKEAALGLVDVLDVSAREWGAVNTIRFEGRRVGGGCWTCAAVMGLFAWHPLHVESVVWVSERKDVLSTFLVLLVLHFILVM